MSYPIFYKEQLTIGNLNSNVGIITLWTPRQTFTSRLDPNSFAICGQLYSKRGINYIIRNILANPIIDTLIICGANRSESAESLKNFIDLGIDENHNVKSCEKSPVDKEITKEYLELFRKNIKYIDLTGELRAGEIQKKLDEINKSNGNTEIKHWAEPKEFPVSEAETASEFPSEQNVFSIRSEYVNEAWIQILRHIMKFGEDSYMLSGAKVKVLSNLIVTISKEDPDKPELPDFMTFNQGDLKLYYKGFFEKTKQSEDYGYGERMFNYPNPFTPQSAWSFPKEEINTEFLNQVEIIYKKLKARKYDAGAIVSIWNPWIDNGSFLKYSNNSDNGVQQVKPLQTQNVPCMTQLQFSYVNHKLNLTAYFRSNDMFDAWPRNTFALRKLQMMLATKLGMKVGELTTISNLAQIYELNYQNAEEVIKKFENKMFCMQDKRGNLIMEIEQRNGELFIIAKHMSRDGNEVLQAYSINGNDTNSAQKLGDILLSNLVISDLSHSMDVGRELMKAEIAIKSGRAKNYQQDKGLDL